MQLKDIFLLPDLNFMLNVDLQAEEMIAGQLHHPPHPSLPSAWPVIACIYRDISNQFKAYLH